MKYRVTANMFYTNQDDAEEALSKLAEAFERAEPMNPDATWEEEAEYRWEQCFHDENPPRPCVVIQRWVKAP